VNLNQLKLFYLAIKRQSLSNAAAELNITQPAVTKGIQRLQEYYEIKFVERQGIKLVLTKAGTALYEWKTGGRKHSQLPGRRRQPVKNTRQRKFRGLLSSSSNKSV
jgi:biotin operon repressor